MQIDPQMNLSDLASRMYATGPDAFERAAVMRDMLVESGFKDTIDIPDEEWYGMINLAGYVTEH